MTVHLDDRLIHSFVVIVSDQIRKMEAAQGMAAGGHQERAQRAYEEVGRGYKYGTTTGVVTSHKRVSLW